MKLKTYRRGSVFVLRVDYNLDLAIKYSTSPSFFTSIIYILVECKKL